MGNFNFTFIYPKALYEQRQSLGIISNAMRSLGFNVEVVGRNDVSVNGYKFSGSAFYSNDKVGMHHGTIMVAVDCNKLASLLNVSKNKLSTHGVASVRSRVKNLKELNACITIEQIKQALLKSFLQYFDDQIQDIIYDFNFDNVVLQKLYLQYASPNWNMGEFQTYTLSRTKRFNWGEVYVYADVDGKSIKRIALASDSLYPSRILLIERILNNLNANSDDIVDTSLFDKDTQLIFQDILSVYQSVLEEIV